MATRSCSALLALRMRVSMSATGSVSISSLLPRALGHAGDRALMRELAQADPAEAELAEDGARPPAPVAARVVAGLDPVRPLLLDHERCLCHLRELPSSVRAREGHAEPGEQRMRL